MIMATEHALLVSVQNDWLIYMTDASVVLAAVLALVSIIYSGALARKSSAAALAERRTDFELGLLADMSHQHSITGTAHITGYCRALVRDANNSDDLLRATIGVHTNDATRRASDELERDVDDIVALSDGQSQPRDVRENLRQVRIPSEIAEAIERRLPAGA
jgi:hypothetical protein